MNVSDVKDWLSHPVTTELVGLLTTVAILLAIEKIERRVYALEQKRGFSWSMDKKGNVSVDD